MIVLPKKSLAQISLSLLASRLNKVKQSHVARVIRKRASLGVTLLPALEQNNAIECDDRHHACQKERFSARLTSLPARFPRETSARTSAKGRVALRGKVGVWKLSRAAHVCGATGSPVHSLGDSAFLLVREGAHP